MVSKPTSEMSQARKSTSEKYVVVLRVVGTAVQSQLPLYSKWCSSSPPSAGMVLHSGPSTAESRLNSYLLSSCATPRSLGLLSSDHPEHGHHLRQCASALATPGGGSISSAPGPGALSAFSPLALPYMPYLGALSQMDLQMYAALAASTAATPLTAFRSAMPPTMTAAHSPLFASIGPVHPSSAQPPAPISEAAFEVGTVKTVTDDKWTKAKMCLLYKQTLFPTRKKLENCH